MSYAPSGRDKMTIEDRTGAGVQVGHTWDSFEELRVKYAENLAMLEDGIAGRLYVKRNAYVIVNEADFEKLQKLLSDVREMRVHIETLSKTMAVVKNMPGENAAIKAFAELLEHTIGALMRSSEAMLNHLMVPTGSPTAAISAA